MPRSPNGLTPFLVWDAAKLAVAAGTLPDRLVAGRPSPGRPLGGGRAAGDDADAGTGRSAASPVLRLRYEARSSRATSGQ